MADELIKEMKFLSVKREDRKIFGKIRGKFTQMRHMSRKKDSENYGKVVRKIFKRKLHNHMLSFEGNTKRCINSIC